MRCSKRWQKYTCLVRGCEITITNTESRSIQSFVDSQPVCTYFVRDANKTWYAPGCHVKRHSKLFPSKSAGLLPLFVRTCCTNSMIWHVIKDRVLVTISIPSYVFHTTYSDDMTTTPTRIYRSLSRPPHSSPFLRHPISRTNKKVPKQNHQHTQNIWIEKKKDITNARARYYTPQTQRVRQGWLSEPHLFVLFPPLRSAPRIVRNKFHVDSVDRS